MREQDFLKHMAKKTTNNKTVGDVIKTLTEEQRNVVNYLIYKALQIGEGKEDGKDDK